MKKMNRVVSVVLIILTAIVGFTCKPGLGSQIDVLPPSGEIIYPDAGETPIRGSFVLKGTAKDDEGVQAVSIVFENIETKDRTRSYQAILTKPGAYNTPWTADIDNESTGTEAPPHELVKIYPIPDGEYTAIVTVTDNNGKTSKFTKNYKIDNTPPVFIVSRPSTTKPVSTDPETGDKYGAIFSVEGQAGERNTVFKLSVEVPEKSLSTSEMFVGKNINAQLFAYGEADAAAWYDYQKNDLHNKAIKAQLFLYDNAQKFSGGAPGTEGNKSEFFYLQDDIKNTVLKKGYMEEVISDYFAGKRGSDKNEHDKKIKALREDTIALNALKENRKMMDGSAAERSTFKLDPNKSPGYKIIGVKNLSKDGLDLAAASTIVFKSGNTSTLLAELIPNKDGDPLVSPATVDSYKESGIKIVLMKWDGAVGTNETDSFKNGTHLVQETVLLDFANLTTQAQLDNAVTKEGSNLRVKFNLPTSFTEGKRAIKVIGTDSTNQVSNTFEAYDDSNSVNNGLYICNFISSGSGPRIRPVRIEGFKNQNFDIFADITDLEPGHAYYKVGGPNDEITIPDPTKELTRPDPVGAPARYKATLDISALTVDKEYTLHFLAKANNGSQDKDKITFTVDKTPPTVALTYPEPTVAQAGEVSFTGTISDAGAGVKASATKFLIAKKSVGTVTPETSGWQNMVTSTAGSWNFKYNFSTMTTPSEYGDTSTSNSNYFDIPIYILAEDNIGNKKVHKLSMILNPDGTKPVVRILSPVNNAVLGGTIQIFGTTSVAIGSPSDIGEAYIQFSKDGSFSGTADGTFSGIDWYNSGNGKIVDDTTANGAVQWTQTINQTGLFNPSGTKWTIYFRVRAKNKNPLVNRLGEWSEKVKIEIDKSSPTIGSPEAIKVVKTAPAVSLDYVPRMWIGAGMELTGSLYDESGIKKLTISGDLKNGAEYDLNQAQTAGWITIDTANSPTSSESGTAKNYKLKIPLSLDDLKPQAKAKGEFTVKISITEDTANNLKSEREFTFRFDTENPSGGFGNMLYVANGTFAATSITDSALANTIRANPAGLKMLVGGKIVTVQNISGFTGNTVNFTPALASAGRYNYAVYKPEILVKAVSGNDWVVRGVANDDGSGVKEVTAKLEVGSASQSVTMTELDPSNKIYRQLDGLCKWEGKINLSSIPDGKGKLTYTITDNSGNVFSAQEDVRVKNKALRVTTVKLSTDIGGTQSTFENTNANNALVETVDANSDAGLTLTSKRFAFKSLTDSKIKVDFTGGEEPIKYTLKYNGNILTGHNMKNISSGDTIALTSSNLNTIGNSTGGNTKDLVLELWDSAEGCTATGSAPLTKSSFAEVTIKAIFDALDDKVPTVVILPFHWNGEGKDSNNNPLNSLYEGSRANGHVEIASVSGMGNTYSSVSGKVSVSGFAYDNIKIDTLEASLPNTAALTVKATRQTDGTWTSDKNMASHGAVLTVETLGADYLGYYVKWRLDWDTEKAGVGVAKSITVSVNDGTNTSAALDGGTSQNATVTRQTLKTAEDAVFANKNPGQFVVFKKGETQYLTRIESVSGNKVTLVDTVPTDADEAFVYGYTVNKAKININVVPYITGIKTALTGSAGIDFDRSALGFYPVYAGEKIMLKGFNIASSPTVKLGTKDLTSKVSAYNQSDGTFAVEITDAADVKTGNLTVTVGTTQAINNGNKNPVIGTDGTVTEAAYNSWSNRANKRLADDLKLSVWKVDAFHSSVQKDITSPMLKIAPDSTWYMSYGNGIPHMAVNKNGNQTHVDKSFNKFHNTAVAFDSTGNIYAVGTNTDRIDNSSAKFSFYSRAVPKSSSNSDYTEAWTGKARLEKVHNQGIYNINRVPRPKLVVTGGDNPTKVYISYFDANHPKNPVKFRYGTVNNSNTFTDGIADGGGTNTSTGAMDSLSNGSAPGYHTIADDDSPRYKGGPYVAHGVTSGGVAVVAWYDATNKCLVYSYNTTPQTPAQGGVWQTNARLIDDDFAGWYVDLAVDKNNGIHIAYYSSSKGDLKYAYLPSYNGTPTVVTVDSYLSVGTQISISTREESGKIVPYISYFQSAFTQTPSSVRVAWRNDLTGTVKDGAKDELFTGNWEVMTIPMKGIIPKDETICNGVPTGGGWANTVVLGFMSDSGYKKAVLKK
ncbi:hypothetical protein ABH09_03650 [Treponema sp. OMZ 803]|uniref:hypothetical protein n=1 Tax=Treponema sp. OMZ 803 TaxID=120682 RepID=UPI0020A4F887|nr:hypothetical protein [Treponema sp. OMZ 803]UTC53763.1 hypothetical protein ABH09_03650 [Treponema sp. OMZ 803]